MITAIIISLSVIVILSVSGFASSQTMPPTVQQMMPKTVQGKYVNSEFGLELTFPEELNPMEVSGLGAFTVNTGLNTSSSTSSGGIGTGAVMTINMIDLPKSSGLNNTSDDKPFCVFPSIGTVSIGGKDAQVREQTCSGIPAGAFAKTKSYLVDLGKGRTVEFVLNSDPSGYDAALKTFEQILKTAKFIN